MNGSIDFAMPVVHGAKSAKPAPQKAKAAPSQQGEDFQAMLHKTSDKGHEDKGKLDATTAKDKETTLPTEEGQETVDVMPSAEGVVTLFTPFADQFVSLAGDPRITTDLPVGMEGTASGASVQVSGEAQLQQTVLVPSEQKATDSITGIPVSLQEGSGPANGVPLQEGPVAPVAGNQVEGSPLVATEETTAAAQTGKELDITVVAPEESTEELKPQSGFEDVFGVPMPKVDDRILVKVGEVVDTNQANVADAIGEKILMKLESGIKEFIIQLNPANLGKLSIKLAMAEDGVKVSILCSNARATRLLSENAHSIGAIVESNTGTAATVSVSQEKENYLQDHQQEESNGGHNQEQKHQNERETKGERLDFIQEMRLGLQRVDQDIL